MSVEFLETNRNPEQFCECGSMAECDLPKVETGVRFPSLAQVYLAKLLRDQATDASSILVSRSYFKSIHAELQKIALPERFSVSQKILYSGVRKSDG